MNTKNWKVFKLEKNIFTMFLRLFHKFFLGV